MNKLRNYTFLLATIFQFLVPNVAISKSQWIKVNNGVWNPSEEQLEEIKLGIENFLISESSKENRELLQQDKYSFQYQGQEDQGKKIIFINAFCEAPKDYDLDNQILIVFDGGSCYLSLKYDLTSKEFYDLLINGEA